MPNTGKVLQHNVTGSGCGYSVGDVHEPVRRNAETTELDEIQRMNRATSMHLVIDLFL